MAYATVEAIKSYLDISSAEHDAVLETLLDAATAFIERYTGKRFRAVSDTHYFGPEAVDLATSTLILDDWAVAITQVINGNGEEIPEAGWVPVPRRPPHFGVRTWYPYRWDLSGHIAVTAKWGWSETPPDDIVHATVRLAAYFYRQRDAQIFDVTAFPDAGAITIPKGVPADVREILNNYRSLV